MPIGSAFMRLLALDTEEGGVSPSSTDPVAEVVQDAVSKTTDLGIESFSSIDLLGFGMCLFLSVFAFKVRSFPFMVVASVGWLLVGAHVTLQSGSVMIFLLTFAVSAIQLVYGAKNKGW